MMPAEQFRQAAAERGLLIPDDMTVGKIQRCAIEGRAKGNLDGAYIFFPDGVAAGGFQNWADGEPWEDWHTAFDRPMTAKESASFRQRMEAAKKMREEEEAARHAAAAVTALKAWEKALECDYHPYLATKGVQPHGLRVIGNELVMPFYTPPGELSTLQFITATGDKRWLSGGRVSGCFYMLGKPVVGVLCIAEGLATGASIHESTGLPVVIAGNAGNMKPVAINLRAIYPKVEMVFCADDDPTGVGLNSATVAAAAVKGRVVLPDGAKDFNDMAKSRGLAAVKTCILGEIEEEAKPSKRLPTIKINSEAQVSNATGTKARVVADAMAGVKAGMKPEELKRSQEHAAAEDLEDMGVALNTHRRVLRAMERASTVLGADPDPKTAKTIAETTEKAVDGIRRIRGLDTKDKPATSEELDERIKAELAKLDGRREKAIP